MELRWLRYGLEEIRLLRSFGDLEGLLRKLTYIVPRVIGGPVRDTEVPPSLQLEPTNHCSLNCICCSRDRMKRERGYMDFDLFRKIIDDAAQTGVKRIHLYLHGEPLLHPRIVEMIGYTKSKRLGINMTTNGVPLTRERIEAILRCGVNSADHFTFSILGYSKEVHESIMRGVDHDAVLRNLFDFLELRRAHKLNGPIIETVFYKMPENEREEKQFVRNWRGIVDHIHLAGNISNQFSGHRKGQPVLLRTSTCTNLWERMTVFWNGEVTLCIADLDGDHILGSLKQKSVKEIWNCEELTAIRSSHKRREFNGLPLCSTCDW